MPNFKKLAKGYEDNALKALLTFASIKSEYDASSIKEGQPYGAGVKNALDYLAKLGNDFGFKVDKVNGYCTEISIGEEGPLVGIYGHSDVVPATKADWKIDDPYNPKVIDGVVYGRGVCDDKGPLIASLYALKLLKDNGLVKGFRVKLVSGGDEERGSSCLRYYFDKHKGEQPDFGFTPDADYPLIYAEKGIRDYWLTKRIDLSPVIAIDGGVVFNAVNDSLAVTLPSDKKFESYLKKNHIDCDINPIGGLSLIRFKGKTAHGSTPEKGESAILKAFKALGEFYEIDALLNIALKLSDCNGESFHGKSNSKELGLTTYNYGICKYDGRMLKLSLDFRFGEEADPDKCIENLLNETKMEGEKVSEAPMLIFDKKSPLVSTLMKAYRKETLSFFEKPIAIGGGTYAKEAKNTVAFGACFKKSGSGNMHSPNEYIPLKDFYKDIAIYARAIWMLGNIKK